MHHTTYVISLGSIVASTNFSTAKTSPSAIVS